MATSPVTIRQISPADLDLMKKLLAMFGKAFGEPATYGDAVPGDAYLQRLLGKPHFIALAALQGEAVVGGLASYELEKFEQERSEIYVYDLAVAEGCRRQGIATALIAALQRIGAMRGAYVIFVQADPGDDPAIALYSKLGMREDVHHFDIAVNPSRKSGSLT
jgi:aminoglycoside 3-N-acetyltransferase I